MVIMVIMVIIINNEIIGWRIKSLRNRTYFFDCCSKWWEKSQLILFSTYYFKNSIEQITPSLLYYFYKHPNYHFYDPTKHQKLSLFLFYLAAFVKYISTSSFTPLSLVILFETVFASKQSYLFARLFSFGSFLGLPSTMESSLSFNYVELHSTSMEDALYLSLNEFNCFLKIVLKSFFFFLIFIASKLISLNFLVGDYCLIPFWERDATCLWSSRFLMLWI